MRRSPTRRWTTASTVSPRVPLGAHGHDQRGRDDQGDQAPRRQHPRRAPGPGRARQTGKDARVQRQPDQGDHVEQGLLDVDALQQVQDRRRRPAGRCVVPQARRWPRRRPRASSSSATETGTRTVPAPSGTASGRTSSRGAKRSRAGRGEGGDDADDTERRRPTTGPAGGGCALVGRGRRAAGGARTAVCSAGPQPRHGIGALTGSSRRAPRAPRRRWWPTASAVRTTSATQTSPKPIQREAGIVSPSTSARAELQHGGQVLQHPDDAQRHPARRDGEQQQRHQGRGPGQHQQRGVAGAVPGEGEPVPEGDQRGHRGQRAGHRSPRSARSAGPPPPRAGPGGSSAARSCRRRRPGSAPSTAAAPGRR